MTTRKQGMKAPRRAPRVTVAGAMSSGEMARRDQEAEQRRKGLNLLSFAKTTLARIRIMLLFGLKEEFWALLKNLIQAECPYWTTDLPNEDEDLFRGVVKERGEHALIFIGNKITLNIEALRHFLFVEWDKAGMTFNEFLRKIFTQQIRLDPRSCGERGSKHAHASVDSVVFVDTFSAVKKYLGNAMARDFDRVAELVKVWILRGLFFTSALLDDEEHLLTDLLGGELSTTRITDHTELYRVQSSYLRRFRIILDRFGQPIEEFEEDLLIWLGRDESFDISFMAILNEAANRPSNDIKPAVDRAWDHYRATLIQKEELKDDTCKLVILFHGAFNRGGIDWKRIESLLIELLAEGWAARAWRLHRMFDLETSSCSSLESLSAEAFNLAVRRDHWGVAAALLEHFPYGIRRGEEIIRQRSHALAREEWSRRFPEGTGSLKSNAERARAELGIEDFRRAKEEELRAERARHIEVAMKMARALDQSIALRFDS